MSDFIAPAELSKMLIKIGQAKANNKTSKLIILGLLAGIYIGFAAHLATTVATGWEIGGAAALFGLKKFFVGAVFSVGLMLVIIPGSELFTGNCLLSVGYLNKDISLGGVLRNWTIVWTANLVGSIFLAWMISSASGLNGGAVGVTAMKIANSKCALSVGEMLARGILANWLVCLAVMMAISAKDIAGKILAIFFPIMAFVTSGYEHSIANMYFIPAGLFTKVVQAGTPAVAELTALTLSGAVVNIIYVTIGNIIGGAVFVGAVYWWLYVKGTKKQA